MLYSWSTSCHFMRQAKCWPQVRSVSAVSFLFLPPHEPTRAQGPNDLRRGERLTSMPEAPHFAWGQGFRPSSIPRVPCGSHCFLPINLPINGYLAQLCWPSASHLINRGVACSRIPKLVGHVYGGGRSLHRRVLFETASRITSRLQVVLQAVA